MQKIIFGIFAHPDDEAFGPAGTLLKETRADTELHLITLTNGSAGTNPDGLVNLGKKRLEEWHEAGRLLGAATMHHFGYDDGELNNKQMREAGQRLVKLMSDIVSQADTDADIECMTLDLNGYTGHIDHIVAARATCFAFYTLKKTDQRFSRIRFACLPSTLYPHAELGWIYQEAGRTPEEVDETVDARELRDDILKVMQAHQSQRGDYHATVKSQGDDLGLNYFIVRH